MWTHVESDRFHCAVIPASVLGCGVVSLGDWCPTAEDQCLKISSTNHPVIQYHIPGEGRLQIKWQTWEL